MDATASIRRPSSPPFYCDPLLLFIFAWIVMLGSLRFNITEVSYPDFSLPVEIFAASLASFMLGYYLVRTIYWRQVHSGHSYCYEIDLTKLRRFNLIASFSATILLGYNYFTSGLPPFFGFLGLDTKSVNDYGRWKQLLGPILMTLFVNAFLDSSIPRRAAYAAFSFLSMLFYSARGGVLVMLFQTLIVLSLRSAIPKKKIYLIALVGVVISGVFFGVLGSARTTDAILFEGMQIKAEFQDWPTPFVWIISYVSSAISNLCWFVSLAHFDHVTWTFSYTLLPAFWNPPNPHEVIQRSSNIIDGTSTYLANYFLDFSYPGIFAANFLLGMISGFGSVGNRIRRHFLVWAVFISCIGFIFFWDFFATLSTVISIGIQTAAQRYFVKGIQPQSAYSLGGIQGRRTRTAESSALVT